MSMWHTVGLRSSLWLMADQVKMEIITIIIINMVIIIMFVLHNLSFSLHIHSCISH